MKQVQCDFESICDFELFANVQSNTVLQYLG